MAKKNISFEEALSKLEKIVSDLENNDIPLEKSIQLYKQGMELLKYCSEKLDTVEKKMLQMNEDGTLSEFSK